MVVLNWFGLVVHDMDRLFPDENMPGGRVGHAGAVETSINLHLRGELCSQGSLETHLGPQMPDFVRKVGGYVQTPREDLSPSGVMGDPKLASAERAASCLISASSGSANSRGNIGRTNRRQARRP